MKLSNADKECWSVFKKIPGNCLTGWEESY